MYSFKLLGLVLSTLLTISPGLYFDEPTPTTSTDYDGTEIVFPFTRQDRVFARVSYRVDDLGEISIGGLYHNYNIDYTVQIYCSSACQIGNPMTTESYATNHEYHIFSRVSNKTPSEIISVLRNADSIVQSAENNTYQDKSTIGQIQLPVNLDYGSITINIYFPALTEKSLLADIDYDLHDFKFDYELVNKRRLIYQLVLDKDVDAEYQRRVIQLLNQNDIDGAYNLVNNYYNTYAVQDTEDKEISVNNYKSKETTLNNLYQTENTFTNNIENQLNQQLNNIDTNNSVITNSNFQKSANWVTRQFNRLTNDNAFGYLLGFSLLLGLAMAIIGRIL